LLFWDSLPRTLSVVGLTNGRSLSSAHDDNGVITDKETSDDIYESKGAPRQQFHPYQKHAEANTSRKTSNHLTNVLATVNKNYPRTGYQSKQNLGRIHPITLKRVRCVETPSIPSNPRPKPRRVRVKLSSLFAIYMQAVQPLPSSTDDSPDGPGSLPFTQAGTTLTGSAASPQAVDPEQHVQGSLTDVPSLSDEARMLQDLESVKKTAAAQSEAVATEFLTYLASRGYTLRDFAVWNWIFSGKSAEDAAARFELLINPPPTMAGDFGPIPIFVFLRLLRRRDISARALAYFIQQAWRLLDSCHQYENVAEHGVSVHTTTSKNRSFDLDSLMIMTVRLLRHACAVWPAACINIASLWVTHAKIGLVVRDLGQGTMSAEDSVRLTFCYNRLLYILALPPAERPYQSLHHRQRAQFMVIRQMNTFQPPLAIDREGYRAVTRVQLAHRKTSSERRWASLKGMSWPPWKEDKLGVDANVGVEHGISRASDSLHKLSEAGYGFSGWERNATVLAGWDTDHSPTIQTRSTLVPNPALHPVPDRQEERLQMRAKYLKEEAATLWAVRIKATRTLQEAWTCFLACKDQDIPLTMWIYHAMFEKLVYDNKQEGGSLHNFAVPQEGKDEDQVPMPGDGREVVKSSTSHNEAVSTREPLPTFETLFNQMTCDRIQPSGRFLEFLLNHTKSYAEGVTILKSSNLDGMVKDVMIAWDETPVPDVADTLKNLPDWLFAAYIGFLCRVACPPIEVCRSYERLQLFRHASKLVRIRMPLYQPPWNSLLGLLAQPRSVVTTKRINRTQAITKFHEACRLLECMGSICLDLDFKGFLELCKIVRHAAMSARRTIATTSWAETKATAEAVLDAALSMVKGKFLVLVRPAPRLHEAPETSDSPTHQFLNVKDYSNLSPLPGLMRVPRPAQLHSYIQLLGGTFADYDGLLDLVRWMSHHSAQLIEEAKECNNGWSTMRTCLTAIRAYVEQPLAGSIQHESNPSDGDEQQEKAIRLIDNVRKVIESNEDLGGWPTDEEVDHYISTGERPHNKNAISRQLLGELASEARDIYVQSGLELKAWKDRESRVALGRGTRAVVFASEVDGVFCAGADLKERAGMTRLEVTDFLFQLRETFKLIHSLYVPTISAISSIALGGGLELALATTFRVFTPATVVGLPETRLGIIPGAGGTVRLKNLLGKTKALDLILTGRRVKGEEALRMGLCDQLYGPSLEEIDDQKIGDAVIRQEALEGALKMAREICEGGPATTIPVMEQILKGDYDTETVMYNSVVETQDRNEALRAFREKRKPVFTGR
ncbi:MAG: hypothetical protein Q9179_006423, partial [Wetmoreana sp. 5 TL-2023]